ncbi:MAG: tetratricopeptide repeat protein [Isosphaeraceae bacterium]
MPSGALAPVENIILEGLAELPGDRALRLELAQLSLQRFDCEAGTDQRKGEEAETLFREIRDEDPSSVEARLGLLEIAHRAQDWTEFDELANEVERGISSSTSPDLVERFVITLALAPGGRTRAERLLRAGLDREPRDVAKRILLAVLMEEDDPAQSARELEDLRNRMSGTALDLAVERLRDALRTGGPEWWRERNSDG